MKEMLVDNYFINHLYFIEIIITLILFKYFTEPLCNQLSNLNRFFSVKI